MRTKGIRLILSMFIIASCNNPEPLSSTNTAVNMRIPADSFGCFIPVDSANKMLTSYINSINYTQNDTDLQSIVIDVKQLRRYIDSTPGCDSIAGIKLMFAHTLAYINSGHGNKYAGYRSGQLTLIISAYTASGNYFFRNNKVIDYGAPCPTNCPPGNAASPLLIVPN